MSGKTLGGLIVAVLIIAGVVLVLNQQRGQAPQQETQEVAPTESEEVVVEEKAEEVEVAYTENGFDPQELTVEVGTKVTWMNAGGASLQIASAPHPIHTNYPKLNQQAVAGGESVSFVFNDTGTFKYHNHLNASHTGSVTVE